MINVVKELTHMERERKHVNLVVELDPEVKWLEAQDTQIEQVIINLVRNGIEAMDETPIGKRNLIISTKALAEDKLEFTVSDSGCGINKELIDQLFDPFVTTKKQGMGLGLSISQGIIESHGDQILIHENPEGGVRFSFKLPVVESPQKNEKRKKQKKEELV